MICNNTNFPKTLKPSENKSEEPLLFGSRAGSERLIWWLRVLLAQFPIKRSKALEMRFAFRVRPIRPEEARTVLKASGRDCRMLADDRLHPPSPAD